MLHLRQTLGSGALVLRYVIKANEPLSFTMVQFMKHSHDYAEFDY